MLYDGMSQPKRNYKEKFVKATAEFSELSSRSQSGAFLLLLLIQAVCAIMVYLIDRDRLLEKPADKDWIDKTFKKDKP